MDNQNTNSVEHDYTEIVQRLSRKQKWAYGVGHVLNDVCASMWFTYLIVFFHFVLGFDPILSGVVLLIGQIADAVSTPFIGLHDDLNNQIGPKDVYKFQHIVLIGMAVGIIASITFHSVIQETPHDSTGPIRRNLRPASSFLRDIKFYQVAVVYMTTRLFVNISQIYVPLYLHDTLKMPATSLAIIPLIMYLSSFKVSLIIEKINTKFGRKNSYALGVLMGICACVWIWFGQGPNFVRLYIYPVSLLLGSSGSIMLVTSLGVTADLIGPNTESGAFVYGAMSFTDKLSNGCVVMAIQYTIHKINTPNYYRDVLSLVCGGSAIIGLLMLLSIKSIRSQIDDGRHYRNLQSEDTFEPSQADS
ncbi:hypothetical protein G9C98_003474 [Cotesia typhae]|uniref:Major facilitator superfamily domain-containing protein 12-like n=1 Tax=Cotesia typhae TaxID=2053667 RepID=A0A8J5USA0_9HYME|nr:hypothetical protein G9C98_003474 [Cotesia typhae]